MKIFPLNRSEHQIIEHSTETPPIFGWIKIIHQAECMELSWKIVTINHLLIFKRTWWHFLGRQISLSFFPSLPPKRPMSQIGGPMQPTGSHEKKKTTIFRAASLILGEVFHELFTLSISFNGTMNGVNMYLSEPFLDEIFLQEQPIILKKNTKHQKYSIKNIKIPISPSFSSNLFAATNSGSINMPCWASQDIVPPGCEARTSRLGVWCYPPVN